MQDGAVLLITAINVVIVALVVFTAHRVMVRRNAKGPRVSQLEQRLRELLTTLPIGIAMVDRDGRVLFANSSYRQTFPDGACDDCSSPAHNGKDAVFHKNAVIARALRGERLWPGEQVHIKDAERGSLWMQLGAVPLVRTEGDVIGAAVVLLDIDEQKQTEADLAEQQRLYKSVTDNATTALFIMDQHQQCVFMNPAAEVMTGFKLNETRGRPLHDLVHHTRPDGRPYPLSECPIDQAFPKNDREQGEEVFVHKDGHFYPVAFTASPIRDHTGAPVGTVIEVQDVTEQKRIESTLRRQARMLDLSKEAIFTWRLRGGIDSWNDGATALYGYTRQQAVGQLSHGLLGTTPVSSDLSEVLSTLEESGSWRGELQHHTRDGRTIIVESTMQLFRQGQNYVVLECNRDVTDRKRSEHALAVANQRNEIAQAAARAMNYEYLSATGEVIRSPNGFEKLTGYSYDEAATTSAWWLSIVHPDDVTEFWSAVEIGLAAGSGFVIDYRIRHRHGHYIWVHDHAIVLPQRGAEPLRVYGMVIDVSEQKAREEQVKLLLREVNHRAKNMLGLVQSIANQTAANNPTDFLQRFGARIQALAANQDLLVGSAWNGVEMEPLVRAQLAMFEDLLDTRIRIQGPRFRLNATAAQAFGLAMHELATNAVKHGALSNALGNVLVSWRVSDDGLILSWEERGGSVVAPPARQGFGTVVLTKIAKMSVSGDVKLEFRETGLYWELTCPCEAVVDRPEAATRA